MKEMKTLLKVLLGGGSKKSFENSGTVADLWKCYHRLLARKPYLKGFKIISAPVSHRSGTGFNLIFPSFKSAANLRARKPQVEVLNNSSANFMIPVHVLCQFCPSFFLPSFTPFELSNFISYLIFMTLSFLRPSIRLAQGSEALIRLRQIWTSSRIFLPCAFMTLCGRRHCCHLGSHQTGKKMREDELPLQQIEMAVQKALPCDLAGTGLGLGWVPSV